MSNLPTLQFTVVPEQKIGLARVLRFAEYALHCATLLVLTGVIIPLWRLKTGHIVDPIEGDFFQRVVVLLLLTSAIVAAVKTPRQPFTSIRDSEPLVVALIALAFVSVAWSIDPLVTLRRAVALSLTALYGLVLAQRYHPSTILRLVTISLGLCVSLSLLLVFLAPDWGVMTSPHQGAWQGAFMHKNSLGRWSAVGILASASLLIPTKRTKRLPAGCLLVLSIITLVGSRSITPLVAVVSAAAVLVAATLWQKSRWLRAAIILETPLAILIVTTLVFAYRNAILWWLGRDATLTGRTLLWAHVISAIEERWLLGYGYGAFWLGADEASGTVWSLAWLGPHAHNFYLDSLLDFGTVGLIMWCTLFALAVVRGFKALRLGSAVSPAYFGLSFIVFTVVYGIGESWLLRWTSLGIALLIWASSWPRYRHRWEPHSIAEC